jgi:2-oxoglutarate ferredoxin oxidoreductase subunit alpha
MGPSTGGPTSPAQGDVMQARWGTHGDHPIIAISPGSVLEAYILTIKAVNFAEKYRVPVIFLLDEVVGHMREKVVLPSLERMEIIDRQRPTVPPEEYRPYAVDDSLIPEMADFGTGYRWHVTGLNHTQAGSPTNNPEIAETELNRLFNKLDPYIDEMTFYQAFHTQDAEYLLISFGGTARTASESVDILRSEGIKAGLLQLQTIWPFPDKIVKEYTAGKKGVFVAELNLGQVRREVERLIDDRKKLFGINKINGEILTPQEMVDKVKGAVI